MPPFDPKYSASALNMPSGTPLSNAPQTPLMANPFTWGRAGKKRTGKTAVEGKRDRWASALQQSQGVYAGDPLTAGLKALTGGLAGYQAGKADQELSLGQETARQKFADALAGKVPIDEAMADTYMSPGEMATLYQHSQRGYLNPLQQQQFDLNKQMNPLTVQETQLGVQGKQADLAQRGITDPLEVERMKLGNEGARLGNRAAEQQYGFNEQMQPLQVQGAELGNQAQSQNIAQGEQTFNMEMQKARVQVDTMLEQLNNLKQGEWSPQVGPDGTIAFINPKTREVFQSDIKLPSKPKDPTIETFQTGDEKVTALVNPDGSIAKELGRGTIKPDTVVNMAGENSFEKEAGGAQAKRFDAIVQSGDNASQMIGDVQALRELGTAFESGMGAQVMERIGPYAEALGINIEGLAPMQAYQAVVSGMVPRMRVPGSGTTSDFDARMFLQSLPSLGKTEEGNAMIQNTLEALARHKMAAADIASAALRGDIERSVAEKQIRELPDPWTMFKEYQKRTGQAQPQPGGGVPGGKTTTGIPWRVVE